jgi:hypothetical protein
MRVSRSAGVATSSVLAAGTLASLTTGCAAVIVRRPRVAAGTGSSSRSNRLQHAHVAFELLLGESESLARGSPGFRDVGGSGEYVASRIFVLVGEFGFHRCMVFRLAPSVRALEYIQGATFKCKKKGPERAFRARVLQAFVQEGGADERPQACCISVAVSSVRSRTYRGTSLL